MAGVKDVELWKKTYKSYVKKKQIKEIILEKYPGNISMVKIGTIQKLVSIYRNKTEDLKYPKEL